MKHSTSDSTGNGTDKHAYPFWIRQVKQWQLYNANPQNLGTPVAGPPDQGEGSTAASCTFTLSPSQSTYTVPYTGGVPNTYWFGDAILIKQYGGTSTKNGNTDNYVSWLNTNPNAIPSWLFAKPNSVSSDVVYEVCTCASSDTCQHIGGGQ